MSLSSSPIWAEFAGKLPPTPPLKTASNCASREIYASYSQVRDCSFDFQAGNLPTGECSSTSIFLWVRSLLLTILADGTETEVGMVGNEGIAGISVFLGIDTTSIKAIVQIPGDAMRMRTSDFQAELLDGALHNLRNLHADADRSNFFRGCLQPYHHSSRRTLLPLATNGDRAKSDHFLITQEFLSHMLGVRRASVTVVAGMLQGD